MQLKRTERWKKSSAFKQLSETLLSAIKMCTGFTADGICLSRMCAVSLVNHLIAVADAKQLRCELHKSAVPLIVRTLLMVKAANIYRNTIIKCKKR